jgi:hypothetical protein
VNFAKGARILKGLTVFLSQLRIIGNAHNLNRQSSYKTNAKTIHVG